MKTTAGQIVYTALEGLDRELAESNRIRSELCATVEALRRRLEQADRIIAKGYGRGYRDGLAARENPRSSFNILRGIGTHPRKTAEEIHGPSQPSLEPKPFTLAIEAGDIWRSKSNETRCIEWVHNGDVSYIYSRPGQTNVSRHTCSLDHLITLFQFAGEPRVVRCSFIPAERPEEPFAGIAVGDVWTTREGHIRRIMSVAPDAFWYDFREGPQDTEKFPIGIRRGVDSFSLTEDGATLCRE